MKTWIISFLVIFVILSITLFILTKGGKDRQTIIYAGQELEVLVVKSLISKAQGLSNIKQDELGADGMLFVFSDYKVRTFWMKQMEFDLDVIWIKDNRILQIDKNVPAPGDSEEAVRMNSNPQKVNYVLEIPSGNADKYGFIEGSIIDLNIK